MQELEYFGYKAQLADNWGTMFGADGVTIGWLELTTDGWATSGITHDADGSQPPRGFSTAQAAFEAHLRWGGWVTADT